MGRINRQLILFSLLLLPAATIAQGDPDGRGQTTTTGPLSGGGPVSDPDQLVKLLKSATDYLLLFAGPIFGIMMIVGGLIYITSAGNTNQAALGKKTLIGATIGLLILLLGKVGLTLWVNLLGGGATPW